MIEGPSQLGYRELLVKEIAEFVPPPRPKKQSQVSNQLTPVSFNRNRTPIWDFDNVDSIPRPVTIPTMPIPMFVDPEKSKPAKNNYVGALWTRNNNDQSPGRYIP